MPYPSNSDLPQGVKVLPAEAQTIWRKTFNSSLATYNDDEDRARKVAWTSVKRKYKKNDNGEWVLIKPVQSFLELVCKRIDAFTQSEILHMIPRNTLNQIREKDKHPYFAAYSICHEGVSSPKVIGEGFKPILWTRKAVQSLKGVVLKGLKFFLGHNEDNSTNDREPVGTVVADTQKEIDGKLHHIVVGYFPNKEIVANKDVCSQEGNWNLLEMAKRWVADTVHKITAIALGDSKIDTPAFNEAKRLGMVQAFETSGTDDKNKQRAEERIMDIQELRDAVRKLNVIPSQLYMKEDIEKDREFAPIFESHKKDIEAKETEIANLKKDKDGLNRQVQQSTAKTRLTEMVGKRSLTEKQKEYITSRFNDTVNDMSDDGLQKYIDEKLEDYKTNASFFGTEEKEDEMAEGGTGKTDDLTKAENNELLDEDFDEEDIG